MQDLGHVQGGRVTNIIRSGLESRAEYADPHSRKMPVSHFERQIGRPGPPPQVDGVNLLEEGERLADPGINR